MLSAQLADKLGPMLGKPPSGTLWRDQVSQALTAGLENGTFVRAHHGIQPLGAAVMERQIADAVAKRLAKGFVPLLPRSDIEQLLGLVQAEDDIRLNEEQRAALDTAVGYEFVCITGGAGVGKTTVLKALYRLLDHSHVRVIQLALAGRAAKRMTEATGRPASTIAGFMKNLRDDSLDGPTAIVVDESSMVDVISMSQLCARLPDHVRLVLVGDPHQLMPVGPGLVLHVLSCVFRAIPDAVPL
jgi:exodeoxyribonuclease V alpha subunit